MPDRARVANEVNDEASFLILTGVVEIEFEEEVFFLTSIRAVEIEVEEETSSLGSIGVDLGGPGDIAMLRHLLIPGRPLASVHRIDRT